jgi:hypothetical protein
MEYEGKVVVTIGDRPHTASGKELRISFRTDDPSVLFDFEKLLWEYTSFDTGYGCGARDWNIPLPVREREKKSDEVIE